MSWRNAIRNRSFTLITLCSLILGITLFFLISIWVRDELSYDTHFKSPERICRVETKMQNTDGTSGNMPTVGWPVGRHLLAKYPEVEAVTYMRNWWPIIKFKGNYLYEDAMLADKSFFDVFGYELLEGDPATALEAPYSLVISSALKEKYFGKEAAIGKVLMISDTVPYTITGIFKDLPAASHLRFDMLGSFATVCAMYPKDCEKQFVSGWFDLNVYNYVKLRNTATVGIVESKIRDLVLEAGKETVKATGFKATLGLRPVGDIYLYSGMPTGKGTVGSITSIKLLLAIGIFILLIACLNFINLSTAKSVERAKEIGVQKVLGNNRRRLILQFLTEAACLCVLAAIVSAGLMVLLLPLFNEFTGKAFTIASVFSVRNSIMLTGIVVVLVPLAGFYPAWVMSSFRPIIVLKGNFQHSSSGTFLRKALVVTQFVISAGFIMSTIIMWQQVTFMQKQELGFDKDNILLVNLDKLPWKLRHNGSDVFKSSMLGDAGVKYVTACGAVPGRTGWDGQFAYPEGRSKDESLSVEYISVDADYLRTIGLELKAGRDFLAGSKADEEEAFIINETAVQYFGWGDANKALGKKLSTSGKDGKVVGVVKDYHQHGLQEQIRAVVLSPLHSISFFAIRYDGIAPRQVIAHAQAAWDKVYKGFPIEYRFLDEDYQRQYMREEKHRGFIGLAAILSVVIGCLGLLGLVI